MQPYDLAKFEDERRYATLVALAIEGIATVIDELIDLHDRIMVKVFNAGAALGKIRAAHALPILGTAPGKNRLIQRFLNWRGFSAGCRR